MRVPHGANQPPASDHSTQSKAVDPGQSIRDMKKICEDMAALFGGGGGTGGPGGRHGGARDTPEQAGGRNSFMRAQVENGRGSATPGGAPARRGLAAVGESADGQAQVPAAQEPRVVSQKQVAAPQAQTPPDPLATGAEKSVAPASPKSVAPPASEKRAATPASAPGATPGQAASSSWAPYGNGPYTQNIQNATDKEMTVTLTGNEKQPVTQVIPPNSTMALTLPAGFGGNIQAHTPGDSGNGTLFEFALGSGEGSQSFFDVSNIVDHNISMQAHGGATATGGDSDSESTGLDHYVGPVDDNAAGTKNPVKSTFGSTMSLVVGASALNTSNQPASLGTDADFYARDAATGVS